MLGVVLERLRAVGIFRFGSQHIGQFAVMTRQLMCQDVDVVTDIAWVDRLGVVIVGVCRLVVILTLLMIGLLSNFNLPNQTLWSNLVSERK